MQKRNLTKEKIIEVSFSLADEIGLNQLTFQKIAEKLNIKSPSLYNHFNNINSLKIEMTVSLLNDLNKNLMQKLIGKSGREAIIEYAHVYKNFAVKNETAYRLFMSIPSTENPQLLTLAKENNNIIKQLLEIYIQDETILIYKSRAIRSLLHGFVSLYSFGYFNANVNLEESFDLMIDDFILSLSNKIN